jgi:hypothetical protein
LCRQVRFQADEVPALLNSHVPDVNKTAGSDLCGTPLSGEGPSRRTGVPGAGITLRLLLGAAS